MNEWLFIYLRKCAASVRNWPLVMNGLLKHFTHVWIYVFCIIQDWIIFRNSSSSKTAISMQCMIANVSSSSWKLQKFYLIHSKDKSYIVNFQLIGAVTHVSSFPSRFTCQILWISLCIIWELLIICVET